MKDLYLPISIPFSIDIDFKKFISQQTRCGTDLLEEKVHSWIDHKINATVLWTEVFYLSPYQSYDIHCDGHEIDNKCKLNYIINGSGSTMIWYEAVDENKIISAYSKSNTRYLKLDKSNSREINRAELTEFNLVNVGNFHTVVNSKNDRWCVSIVVGDKNSKERLNYNEIKLRLNIK